MAYLNYTQKPIELKVSPHPKFETRLELRAGTEELLGIKNALQEVLNSPKSELRIDLPQKWTLFWKLRELETRQLLAHPEADAWVASVALTREHCETLIAILAQTAEAGSIETLGQFEMSRLGPTSRISNFEMTVSRI